MQRKLSNWKAKSLSLAGRILLAKNVLSTIPYYTMQMALLPKCICKKLDSITRRLIWGSTEERKGVNLIKLKWDTLCQPVEKGGLGFRPARKMNIAPLMKLGWESINDTPKLWTEVVKAKYLKKPEDWWGEPTVGPQLGDCHTRKLIFFYKEGDLLVYW